ncbi:hypothetical protein ACLUWA_04670 [Bifidobacterium thermophilum]|uniref:hypothetical protein n=1 Tax=Bifidobacterium thermophilum TaxID=33905 RepID=UPI003992FF00
MYKTVEIGYHPKASDMAAAIERAANELAAQGYHVVSFSVTGSAKTIVLAEKSPMMPARGRIFIMNTNLRRALLIIGVIGIVFGVVGYSGLLIGGNFGAFVKGMTPGILLGLSALVIIVVAGRGQRHGD